MSAEAHAGAGHGLTAGFPAVLLSTPILRTGVTKGKPFENLDTPASGSLGDLFFDGA